MRASTGGGCGWAKNQICAGKMENRIWERSRWQQWKSSPGHDLTDSKMLHAVTGAEPPCLPQEKSAQEKKTGPQICRQTTAMKNWYKKITQMEPLAEIEQCYWNWNRNRLPDLETALREKQTARTKCKKRFFSLNLNKIHTIIEVTVISLSFDRKLKIIFSTLIL
jgi:hypothetical protein